METIHERIDRIGTILKQQGRYDSALLPQVMALAGAWKALDLANADIDKLAVTTVTEISRYGEKIVAHPAFKVQRDAMEQVSKQMKVLGLTFEDLGAGVESDPLIEMTRGVMEASTGKGRIKAKK